MRQKTFIKGATALIVALLVALLALCVQSQASAAYAASASINAAITSTADDTANTPTAVDDSTDTFAISRSCSLTINCAPKQGDSDTATPIEGMTFKLYRVAEFVTSSSFAYVGGFEDWPAEYINTSATSVSAIPWDQRANAMAGKVMVEAADNSLLAAVDDDAITTAAIGKTDAQGNVAFAPLETGLYLVIADPIRVDGLGVVTAAPTLITLPGKVIGDKWDYTEDISEKLAIVPYTDEYVDPVTVKVQKIWNDSGHEFERPTEVKVVLYKDGARYESATLSASNNWICSWVGLAGDAVWTVVEDDGTDAVAADAADAGSSAAGGSDDSSNTASSGNTAAAAGSAGYYVWSITNEDNTFYLTNTYVEPTSGEPTETVIPGDPTPTTTVVSQSVSEVTETLPQTGQAWWPVSVLVVCGVGLFSLGWLVTARERRRLAQGAKSKARRKK